MFLEVQRRSKTIPVCRCIEGGQKTMEKEKREQESCTSCAYRKDWYCPVAGDRVKREGHCSEYEKSKIAKEK